MCIIVAVFPLWNVWICFYLLAVYYFSFGVKWQL